jgi:N-acyl homoserine lactone hydrolase
MRAMSRILLFFILLTAPIFLSPAIASDEPLSLYVLDCGSIHGIDSARFLPGVEDRPERLEMVNRCYLINHPDGTLLWDLGFPRTLYYRVLATLYWAMSLGRSSIDIGAPLTDQLRRLGFDPPDIDFVVTSHMHFDHVGAANEFADATWLVQGDERDWALSEDLDIEYVDKDLYATLAAAMTIELSGNYDVFGDNRVVILSTPGHTPGHQSLFIDLAETGPVVLSGDLYHNQLNRSLGVAPEFNVNRKQTLESMRVIEDFLTAHNAQLWIQHDPRSGPEAPAVLR